MQALTQSYFDSFIIILKKFLISFVKLWPFLSTQSINYCWEIKCTTIYNLIIPSDWVHIIISHSTKFMDQFLIDLQILQSPNKSAQVFVSWKPYPFVTILQKPKHQLGKLNLFFLVCGKFCHIDDDIYASFSNSPVICISSLFIVEW